MAVEKLLTKTVNIAPFIMIIISGLSAYLWHQEYYPEIYKYLGDSMGYSILTNLVFLKYYQRKAYCNPTKIAVYGLLLMNVVSLLVRSDVLPGRYWYDIAIGFTVLIIIIIGVIKRW